MHLIESSTCWLYRPLEVRHLPRDLLTPPPPAAPPSSVRPTSAPSPSRPGRSRSLCSAPPTSAPHLPGSPAPVPCALRNRNDATKAGGQLPWLRCIMAEMLPEFMLDTR